MPNVFGWVYPSVVMGPRHRWLALPLLLAGIALVAQPVGATSAATTGQYIHGLANRLLLVAVPITLLVEGLLFYAIWRFSRNEEATPTRDRRRLEIGWTVATALILLFVGVSAYGVMAHPAVTPTQSDVTQALHAPGTVVINVTGSQWYWTFTYPQYNVTTQGSVEFPAGRQLVLRITSTDVIHSVFIPKMGIKKDAIPGKTNYELTTVSNASVGHQYVLFCAEYCGVGHSDMRATVNVVSPSQFHGWIRNQTASSSGA